MTKKILKPQYIDDIKESNKYYGTIEYCERTNSWSIKGEPHVIDKLSRLFKSTKYHFGDEVFIPNNKRLMGDLNWVLMRYPMKILNPDLWDDALRKGKEFIMNRQRVATMPKKSKVPQEFKGDLYDFQKKGLAYLHNNKKCLLADEMGLGKTVQALAFLCKSKEYPALIVTPAHLQLQWVKETERFLGEDVSIHQITGTKPYKLPDTDIHFVHYLLIRKWWEMLASQGYETVILDECQELRRTESLKYECTEKVIETLNPNNIIGLSGTPIYNYGIEIFNIMNVIDEGCLGTRKYFVQEWTVGGHRDRSFGRFNPAVKYPEILGSHMQDHGLMLRRRKEEVMSELPEKNVMVQYVEFDKEMYVDNIDKSIELAKKIEVEEDQIKGAMMLEAVSNARRSTGIAKSKHVAEFVKILLQGEQPTIVFAYHHDVMQLYEHYLGEYLPAFVHGKLTTKQKAENIDRFMDRDTDLIIINLRTTAGLNLQRARCVVFGELDWSPSVHTQAEDRAHRIGQKESVMAYYMVAETSTDKNIIDCLGLKREQFMGIMKDKPMGFLDRVGKEQTASKFMWKIIDDLQKTGKREKEDIIHKEEEDEIDIRG